MKASDWLHFDRLGVVAQDTATPEEVEWAKDTLLGCSHIGRERVAWLADELGSPAEVLQAVMRGSTPNGGGSGPGRVGQAVEDEAYRYGIGTDGIVAVFGSEPDRWRLNWGWSGLTSDVGRFRRYSLMYLLDDVPLEKIRHVKLTIAEVVRQEVERRVQPSLLDMAV